MNTAKGEDHFAQGEQKDWETDGTSEWSPELCKTQNCSVKILHIASKGYDEGLVEQLIETMKVPAKVEYLGQTKHTQAIWNAYTKISPALVYSYYPNVNQHGISILHLPRAKIAPGIDFKSQRLAVWNCTCMPPACVNVQQLGFSDDF